MAVKSRAAPWRQRRAAAAAATFLPAVYILRMASAARPASPDHGRDASATLWPLRLLLGLCIGIPLLIFAIFATYRWHAAHDEARQHVTRMVAVAHEHALKVLDNNETLLGRVLELVGTDDDAAISQHEAAVHQQLTVMAGDRLQIQSIWVWGPDGRPLAGNRFFPVPADLNVADREFFRHHRDRRGGLYFTESLVGKATRDAFFDMSLGRYRSDGAFAGLVSVGLYPSYFERFHADLIGDEPGSVLVFFRADGAIYSRVPANGDVPARLSAGGPLLKRVQVAERAPPFEMLSPVDGVRRIVGYRKIGKYPLFVAAGVDLAAVRAGWLQEMAILAALGILPLAGLVFAAVLATRRTQQAFDAARNLQDEMAARQHAEQALFQSKKLEAVGRLAGGVAHDFNNALMVVSGNLFILQRLLAGAHAKYTDAINRGVESASKLTKQLLAFSRQSALSPEILRLQDRLPAMEPLLAPLLGTQVTLSIAVASDTRPVQADPAELELTLINLALNARDAIDALGHLHLRAFNLTLPAQAARPGSWVVIEARDDGKGMDRKLLENIFDPFFTTKQVGKGTGLGLSQVYAFCQRCGGWAEADSSPGEGTVIRLFLAPATADGGTTAAPAQPGVAASVAARVLLVDDNPEIAAVLEQTLVSIGCAVACVESADAAVHWLDANSPPDLVLTDIMMPGHLDGLDLVRHVRKRYPHQPVIVMTGYSEQIDQVVALGVPMLAKPFSPQALIAAMTALNIPAAAA
jgi:signal transduction histidine kinase